MARSTIEVRLIASGAAGARRDIDSVASSATRMGREIDKAASTGGGSLDRLNVRLKSTTDATRRASEGLIGTGQKLTLFASLPIAAGLYKAEQGAAALNETVSFTGRVFGDSADDILAWGDTTLETLGLSRRAALDAANGLGGMIQSAGLTADEAGALSQQLVKLGVDMTSAVNPAGGLAETLNSVQRALIGEFDPIQKFLPTISAATVQQYAYANGIAAAGSELTQQQKILATLGTIVQLGAKYNDDYALTADSAANSQRRAGEAAKQAGDNFGQTLIPLATRSADIVEMLSERFEDLPSAVQTGIAGVAVLGTLAGPVLTLAGHVTQLTLLRRISTATAAQSAAAETADATAKAANIASTQTLAVAEGQLALALEGEAAAATTAAAANAKVGATATGMLGPIGLAVAALAVLAYATKKAFFEGDQGLDVSADIAKQTDRQLADVGRRINDGIPGVDKQKAFHDIAETNIGTARRMAAAMRAAGEDTTLLDKAIARAAAEQRRMNADQQASTDGAFDLKGALSGLNTELDGTAAAAKTYSDGLDSGLNRILDAASASRSYASEVERLNEMLDGSKAQAEHTKRVEDAADAAEAARRATSDRVAAEQALAEVQAENIGLLREQAQLEVEQADLRARTTAREARNSADHVARLKAAGRSAQEIAAAEDDAAGKSIASRQAQEDQRRSREDLARIGPDHEERLAAATDRLTDARRQERDANQRVIDTYLLAQVPVDQLGASSRELADQLDRVVRAAEADFGAQVASGALTADEATRQLNERLAALRGLVTDPALKAFLDQLLGGGPAPGADSRTRYGVTAPFAQGGIAAHVTDRPMILYGERQTGEEAFIPKLGIPRARGLAIADHAARWHGGRVVPMAAGGVLPWSMASGGSYLRESVTLVTIPQQIVGNQIQNAHFRQVDDMTASGRKRGLEGAFRAAG